MTPKVVKINDENASGLQKGTAIHDDTKVLTIVTKNLISTRISNSTTNQTYPCHHHWMPRRFMPELMKRIDEKLYELYKVKATDEKKELTIVTKIEFRHEYPTPRQYKYRSVSLIECRVDSCLSWWKDLMRRYTNCKKWRRQNRKNTYHHHKKPDCDTNRQRHNQPKVSLLSIL